MPAEDATVNRRLTQPCRTSVSPEDDLHGVADSAWSEKCLPETRSGGCGSTGSAASWPGHPHPRPTVRCGLNRDVPPMSGHNPSDNRQPQANPGGVVAFESHERLQHTVTFRIRNSATVIVNINAGRIGQLLFRERFDGQSFGHDERCSLGYCRLCLLRKELRRGRFHHRH